MCGSSLVTAPEAAFASERTGTELIGLHLGVLEAHDSIQPERHFNVRQKAAWFSISDALPQFDGLPDEG